MTDRHYLLLSRGRSPGKMMAPLPSASLMYISIYYLLLVPCFRSSYPTLSRTNTDRRDVVMVDMLLGSAAAQADERVRLHGGRRRNCSS